jgi:pimeloyl-ACP methyl ester carboxylesterase
MVVAHGTDHDADAALWAIGLRVRSVGTVADDAVHVTTWDDAGQGAPRAVLVHGTMSRGAECFAAQRPLAARFRLELPDRRGYGGSPDTDRSDYEADADDIAALLAATPGGAHLVGHSYGGVCAMYAAARHPESVRSLVLVEPAAMRPFESHPAVGAALARMRASFGSVRADMSPEAFLTRSTEPYGLPVPEFTPEVLRATRTGMHERLAWEADIPLEPLAAAPCPKAVINGTWETADPEHRAFNGDALAACGAMVAARIGAVHFRIKGTDHFPHRDGADEVNGILAEMWSV